LSYDDNYASSGAQGGNPGMNFVQKGSGLSRKFASFSVKEITGALYGDVNLMFEMRDQIVDQTYRFYEIENCSTELKVPKIHQRYTDNLSTGR
jgi:hypothetical protein